MNRICRIWIYALLVFWGGGASVHAGELFVGGGYGEQIGLDYLDQNNAVFDVLYDIYGLDWHNFSLLAGVGLSWLWNDADNKDVLIGHIYPHFRYTFPVCEDYQPYLFVITGFSYMTEPYLGHQVLGGYFAFNDFFGAGARVGKKQVWSVNFCWRHISNAGIFDPNHGVDVPYCILVGRRF